MGRSKKDFDKKSVERFEGGIGKPFQSLRDEDQPHVPTQREIDQRSIEDFEGPGHFKPW